MRALLGTSSKWMTNFTKYSNMSQIDMNQSIIKKIIRDSDTCHLLGYDMCQLYFYFLKKLFLLLNYFTIYIIKRLILYNHQLVINWFTAPFFGKWTQSHSQWSGPVDRDQTIHDFWNKIESKYWAKIIAVWSWSNSLNLLTADAWKFWRQRIQVPFFGSLT